MLRLCSNCTCGLVGSAHPSGKCRNGREVFYQSFNIEERLQISFFPLQWIKKRRKTLKGHCDEAGISLPV